MAVVDASITTTTAVNFIPQIWSTEALTAVEFAASIQKRVYTDWQGEMSIGSTFNIPRISNLTIQSKASGVQNTINFEAIAEGVQQLTISTHQYAAFLIEQVAAVQVNQDLRQKYTKKIGYALARGRDVALATNISNISTNVVGTLGVELTSDDYLRAWQLVAEAGLLENSPDASDDFSIFLSPAAYSAAMKVDVFTSLDYNKEADAITRAHIGDIYGFPVYLSNLLVASGGGHRCALFYRQAFGLVVQKDVPTASQYLIRNLADGVVGWGLYGNTIVSFPPETAGGGVATDNRAVLLNTV